jgi:hypothetical protein
MFQFEAGYMFQFKDTTPVDTMKDAHLDNLDDSIESAKASAAKLVCQSSGLKPDDLEGIYKVIITLEKVR